MSDRDGAELAKLAKQLLYEAAAEEELHPGDSCIAVMREAAVAIMDYMKVLDRASAGEGGEAQPQVAMTDEVREILEDAANKMQAVVRSITDQFPHAHNTIAMLETWSAEVRSNVARTLPAPQAPGEKGLRGVPRWCPKCKATSANDKRCGICDSEVFLHPQDVLAAFRRLSPSPAQPQVSEEMVERALQAFDTGTDNPNDYRKRMRAALESALAFPAQP